MFNLRKKNLSRSQVTPRTILMDNPHHEWIREDKLVFRFFKEALELLIETDFLKLNSEKELCFLYSPGRYASTLPSSNKYNFIILYPDMIAQVKSVDNSIALATLFHEFGHLINDHHSDKRSALIKQIEADNFAIKYKFEEELTELLNGENRTFEVVKRLENIQSYFESLSLDQ